MALLTPLANYEALALENIHFQAFFHLHPNSITERLNDAASSY